MTDLLSLQDIVDAVDRRRDREPGTRRIAVAGEFESGKSSVVNALVGKMALPCNPGLPGRPLIKIRHSIYPMIFAEDTVGRRFEVEAVRDLMGITNLAHCDICIPIPGMARTEIVEIPHQPGKGINKGDLEVLADADLIVWVTIASQAWRLSEKALMETLPEGSREKSVLAISRADHLRDAADWEKIETRLLKEASPYFSEMVFMQASSRNLAACRQNDDAWIKTGGPSLASIAHDLTADKSRARRAGERA